MSQNYTVITGASSGIGSATAKLYANKGSNLILIARRENLLQDLKNEIIAQHPNIDVVIKPFDLSQIDKLSELYQSLKPYPISTWINNAGFGILENVAQHDLSRVQNMIALNVQALTTLSILYVQDYQNVANSTLINVASAAGYLILPSAVTYCASKFYVTAFSEGLAREMQALNAPLQVKVLAPSATKTEFAQVALEVEKVDYTDGYFAHHNTSEEMAEFLYTLANSDKAVGYVDYQTLKLELSEPKFGHLFDVFN